MKRTYIKPAIRVIEISQQQHILEGSLPVGGGTTENQFAREFGFGFNDWDEDEE